MRTVSDVQKIRNRKYSIKYQNSFLPTNAPFIKHINVKIYNELSYIRF
jgi:hypothetical protein